MPTFHGWPSLHTQWAIGHNAVGRMIAERPFADDVVQPPRSHLDAVFVADLQERAQARLQLARRAGQRPFRLQFAPGRRSSWSHSSRQDYAGRGDGISIRLVWRELVGEPWYRDVRPGVSTTMTDLTSGGNSGFRQAVFRTIVRLAVPLLSARLVYRCGPIDDVIEQLAELLEHVAQRRLGAGDPVDLLLGERERSATGRRSPAVAPGPAATAPRRCGAPDPAAALPDAASSACRDWADGSDC